MSERVRAAVMTAPGVIEVQEFPYPKVQPGACCLIKARILGVGEIVAVDLSDFRLDMAGEFSADRVSRWRSWER